MLDIIHPVHSCTDDAISDLGECVCVCVWHQLCPLDWRVVHRPVGIVPKIEPRARGCRFTCNVCPHRTSPTNALVWSYHHDAKVLFASKPRFPPRLKGIAGSTSGKMPFRTYPRPRVMRLDSLSTTNSESR